jgi:hypothetical protein
MTEEALNEVKVDHDALIGKLHQWRDEDAERASSAGETREDIGRFLDKTNVNKKCLSHMRQVDKMSPEKRADYRRSLALIFPMLEAHWDGQGTADMFDENEQFSDDPVDIEDDEFLAKESTE